MNRDIVDHFVAPKCLEQIGIVYEDEFLVAINKPSGLLSLSGKNPLNQDSVHHRLASLFPDIRLTHRLDLGTSGIMLLAKNKYVNSQLTAQFQQRTVSKGYVSVVAGLVADDYGEIDIPIAKDPALFPKLKVCQLTGKPAQTSYQVLERDNNLNRSRVRFTPHTGRTHQLRIHSQAIGHPILGCDLYGNANTLQMAPRLLLHALDISFNHPESGQRMTLASPCPF
ncbi:RluA family pseudouridine synthase [Paraglaciecola aestuariivivens]